MKFIRIGDSLINLEKVKSITLWDDGEDSELQFWYFEQDEPDVFATGKVDKDLPTHLFYCLVENICFYELGA